MKKAIIALVLAVMLSLTGCMNIFESSRIETLKGWSFQYNRGTNDYSVFFGLLDRNNKYISASVDVDIRIVNESGEKVYKATKSVTSRDFGYYTSKIAGEQYLAEIRIPEKDIAPGKSLNGTVYLTVYKEGIVRFDEVNCSALYCLPVSDAKLEAGPFPVEINIKGYDGNIESKIQIDDVEYVYEKGFTPILKITVFGTKTYGESTSSYDKITYKLYDSKGYMVYSGSLLLDRLSQGDKFKDDSIMIYDVVPGETYTIMFSEDDLYCSESEPEPESDVKLEAGSFPVEINVKEYDGSIKSKIQIDDVEYVYEKGVMPVLKITVFGTKTYGVSALSYDIIIYKLYDSKDYMVYSGQLLLNNLAQGDKFKDDSIMIYDVVPGETYTITFSEYDW